MDCLGMKTGYLDDMIDYSDIRMIRLLNSQMDSQGGRRGSLNRQDRQSRRPYKLSRSPAGRYS